MYKLSKLLFLADVIRADTLEISKDMLSISLPNLLSIPSVYVCYFAFFGSFIGLLSIVSKWVSFFEFFSPVFLLPKLQNILPI